MAGLVPAKISDRYAKNGEDMLDVLSHDIMRYEMLAEKETFDALTSVLQGEQSHDNVELHEIEVNRLNNDNNNNDEGDPTETHEQRDTGSSRFRSVSNEDTDEFLRKNVNKNTDYKTRSDVKTFYTWAQQVGEFRELQMIPFKELDAILARFYLGVRNKEGQEYEPDTLTGFQNSIERHLKNNKVVVDLKRNDDFSHSRKVLEAKRKQLKQEGKGNKRNRAEPIDTQEIQNLYDKQLLGSANPTSLLNTVWLKNGVFFGFRGRQEHASLLLGDLTMKQDSNGKEYVEFNERTTKTRTGAKSSDYRAVAPKMFEQKENPNCPIKMLKLYISKRPADLQNDPSSKFYLRPLDKPKEDVWYSHQCIGKNKLGTMMKTMAEAAQLYGRKVNHSTRKTFATSLLHSERLPTEVAQLGGWKGISTLTHYNFPSMKQQDQASNIISNVVIPPCSSNQNETAPENSDKDTSDCPEYDIHIVSSQEKTLDIHYDKENDSELSMFEKPSQASSIVNNSKSNMIANRKDCSNPFSILTGAVINGGVINLNIFSGKRKRDDFSSSQES
ncbi:uncharacterized protein KIAA1958-like [Mytilus galloprovincialis]|uniref:uncharacterized protein KIAA1958-like n=1 Tax=Mytilus galloprovincialis TaxID=29158 RepID=UPI003F7BA9F6